MIINGQMRDHVNSKMFLLRKLLDNFLYFFLPQIWIPLYTTVSCGYGVALNV